jgi:hypothetical protein
MPVAVDLPLVCCVAAIVAAAAACLGAFLVRGSTAVPAAAWACAAALALAAESAVRATGGLTEPAAFAAARLGVVALAMCPTMSLLGAKRPQHGVWQFIVASLAGILALPAVSACAPISTNQTWGPLPCSRRGNTTPAGRPATPGQKAAQGVAAKGVRPNIRRPVASGRSAVLPATR